MCCRRLNEYVIKIISIYPYVQILKKQGIGFKEQFHIW